VCANRETSSRIVILAHRRILKVARAPGPVSAWLIRGTAHHSWLCSRSAGVPPALLSLPSPLFPWHGQSCLCCFFCAPANHASRVAAAQLQDAIFAAAVASLCVLVLAVPPARVFCRRYSRTGLPSSRNRPRESRPGISSISQRHKITVSRQPAKDHHSIPGKPAPTSTRHS
jgi:hypothetical protein